MQGSHLWKIVCCAGFVALLLGAPAVRADDAGLQQLIDNWEATFNAHDAAGIAANYAADTGCRMPPNAETMTGRKAIEAGIAAQFEMGIDKVKIELVSKSVMGDHADMSGTYAIFDADGKSLDNGKWMNTATKVDGHWVINCDIWNSDRPLPEMAE